MSVMCACLSTCTHTYTGEDNTAVYLEDVPIGALPYGEGELHNCMLQVQSILILIYSSFDVQTIQVMFGAHIF